MVEFLAEALGTLKGFGATGVTVTGSAGGMARALLPISAKTTLGPHRVEWISSAGVVSMTLTVEPLSALVHTLQIASMTTKTNKLLEKENKKLAIIFKQATPSWMGAGPFQLPCEGRITSAFGESRVYNDGLVAWRHTGTDIGMNEQKDKTIRAAQSGRIMKVERLKAHGGTVIIDHGCGIHTVYLHMESFQVKKGKKVKKGDAIGVMGKTGLATGIHLHWGAKVAGVTVNPLSLLSLRWPEP